jgi:uncharacterized membrane protein YagU involved in acid resistance
MGGAVLIAETRGGRFARNWKRWYLWILFLGVGYHVGRLIAMGAHGKVLEGVAVFITGVASYVVFSLVFALVPAAVAAYAPRLRIFPTSIAGGIVRAVIAGLIVGVGAYSQ